MKNDWEENTEISMTGHGGTNREAPDRSSQSYFTPPVLDSKDGRDWNSQKQNVNTGNIHNHDQNSRTPNRNSDGKNSWDSNSNNGNEKRRRKAIAATITALVAVVLVFLFWPCSHEWVNATCTTAKVCSKCGETEGTALDHQWKKATCTTAKVCSKCGETEGAALGHQWKQATCVDPSVCSRCKEKSGTALGHSWKQVTERDCVEAKVVTYSQCTVCKKRENQTTSKLTSLLSDGEETFLITPVEFAERLGAMCADRELNVACFWADKVDGEGDPGIEIKEGSDLPAAVWFYGGSNVNNLDNLNKNDKNKESAFSMVQLVMSVEYSEPDALFTAFVMAIDPKYENDPDGAHAIAIKSLQYMQSQYMYEHGNVVYSMNAPDGLLVLRVYAKQLFD